MDGYHLWLMHRLGHGPLYRPRSCRLCWPDLTELELCAKCDRPANGARVYFRPLEPAAWVHACINHRTELELAC